MPNANELRELSADELRGRALELRQQLFDLRSKQRTGVLDSTADLRKTRREIARVLTVARAKELGIDRPARVTPAPEPRKPAKPSGKPAKKAKKE